jgi:hypothetical protein
MPKNCSTFCYFYVIVVASAHHDVAHVRAFSESVIHLFQVTTMHDEMYIKSFTKHDVILHQIFFQFRTLFKNMKSLK